ncbi:MAG: glycosyltransferase family 4 protein [Candidatus Cloacimonetes bacterium]|nr:glycosyltransferase family 4 protein [Candidatus Cloacimonadota bacterium]
MKILHVLAQKPGMTGSGIYLQSVVNEAAKKNYEQAVVMGIHKDESFDFPQNVKVFPVLFETEELPFSVVGMSNIMPYESTRYCDMNDEMISCWKKAFGRQIERAVNNLKPDVILSHHLWMLSVFVKERFPQIPVIAITHGTGLRQMEFAEEMGKYVRSGCDKIDLILCLNEIQKQKLKEKYSLPEEKFVITGTGYDSDIFYLNRKLKPETVRMVYAGKLSRTKGVFSLMNALHKIKIENILMNFIGSSGKHNTVELLEKSAETFHSIIFSGALPQTTLAKIFRKSDLFILPSFYEGLPLVLIEAIACGMNVVVNDLPGLREFLGEEYCESPYVSFVTLPRMKSIDEPYKTDLAKFEALLKTAIETQIYHIAEHQIAPRNLIEKTVGRWTWSKLFNKIETQINKLV